MRLLTAKFESPREVRREEFTISRDELALIVSEAVVHAIRAYERTQGDLPKTFPQPKSDDSPLTKFEQLQRDMGLNEIELAGPAAPWSEAPAATNVLSAEMGIDGFDFDDALETALEPHTTPEPAIDAALADWDEALKEFQEP